MFDFLVTHNHTDNPTALGILITVLCTFFLASMVAITYELTTPKVQKSRPLIQSMVLLAIVAAMVMQAIGDSLARGLGMLGALAIVRFRTKLDNPRNMAFIFAALANGIACGVYGFTIAFIGTAGFCIAAILLRFSRVGTAEIEIGSLKFQTPLSMNMKASVEKILTKYSTHFKLLSERYLNINKMKSMKNEAGVVVDQVRLEAAKEYEYQIRVKSSAQADEMAIELEKIASIKDIKLKFGDSEEML